MPAKVIAKFQSMSERTPGVQYAITRREVEGRVYFSCGCKAYEFSRDATCKHLEWIRFNKPQLFWPPWPNLSGSKREHIGRRAIATRYKLRRVTSTEVHRWGAYDTWHKFNHTVSNDNSPNERRRIMRLIARLNTGEILPFHYAK